jgi:hypothetical protein
MSFQGDHEPALDIKCRRRKDNVLRSVCQFHLLSLRKDGKDEAESARKERLDRLADNPND